MNLERAQDLLLVFMKANIPTFLWGMPGIGKSDMVRLVAAALGLKVIDFRAILRESVDLRGLPMVDKEKRITDWLPPGELPDVERDGPQGIFFMDELNAAPPSMQAACFGLVLDRKVGEYQLPPGWKIVAAGNRQTDRAAAQRMPTPLANRFAHIDIDPDVETFIAHGMSTGKIHPLILGCVRYRGSELLHNMKIEDLRAFPTPRSWERYTEALTQIDIDNDIGMVQRAGEAIVGNEATAEFIAFIRTYSELPSFDSIIRNPDTAGIPGEPSGRFAVSTMLAARIEPKHIEAAYTYLGRVSKEMQTKFMFDLVSRDKDDPKKSFQTSKAWIAWGAANMTKMTNVRF